MTVRAMVPLLLATSTVLAPTRASAFWCRDYLVRPGDHAAQVATRCGDPDARYPIVVRRRHGDEVYVGETWLYNFGPHAFIGLVTFEQGRAVRVEYGDYGW